MNSLEICQTVIFELPKHSVVYQWFASIHRFYRPIHTFLSIFMCAIGTVCNFCNIVILSRKQMRTPVNMILTAMACCDTVVLFSNLIYTTHYAFVAFKFCHPRHWSYGWAMFLIAHAHLSLIGHSSSIWLSVMLALIRYMTLRGRGNINGPQIGLRHSYLAIGFVILFVTIANGPNFLTYQIVEIPLNETCIAEDERIMFQPSYIPGVSDLALRAKCAVFRAAFWMSGTVFKVLPCLLLTLFVLLLTNILNEVKQNRLRLTAKATISAASNGAYTRGLDTLDAPPQSTSDRTWRKSSARSGLLHSKTGGRTDRTTRMLLTIVFVFLITEIPQGVMAVLSGMCSDEFRNYIYNNIGDILDLLSLCNACTTFIIYCSMSGQFRNEFRRVFIPTSLTCLPPPSPACPPSEVYTTKSYLRPSERSVTMTVVGSSVSLRKPEQREDREDGICTESSVQTLPLMLYRTERTTLSTPTKHEEPNIRNASSVINGVCSSHEKLDEKCEAINENIELLQRRTSSGDVYETNSEMLETRYHVV